MITFPAALLQQLRAHAERAYPDEACGLIVGRRAAGKSLEATRIEASANLAGEPARRFEIDPRLHLTLQRRLRDSPEAVIGVYHSHPGGAARPSETDLAEAWEADLVWVIVAVEQGRAGSVTAHRLLEASARFEEIPLRTAPGPLRSASDGGGR